MVKVFPSNTVSPKTMETFKVISRVSDVVYELRRAVVNYPSWVIVGVSNTVVSWEVIV
jgi:hypothetical protein